MQIYMHPASAYIFVMKPNKYDRMKLLVFPDLGRIIASAYSIEHGLKRRVNFGADSAGSSLHFGPDRRPELPCV